MSWRTFKAETLRGGAALIKRHADIMVQWCGDAPQHVQLKDDNRLLATLGDYLNDMAKDHDDGERVTLSTDGDCNGWTNYETWLVKLWLDNDEAAAATAQSLPILYSLETGALAEQIKLLVEDLTLPEEGLNGFQTDLIRSALAAVNWQEIASHFDEEHKDEEAR